MNDEDNQLDNYTYDVERTKKTSTYNQTDEYIQSLMSNYISEWCSNNLILYFCIFEVRKNSFFASKSISTQILYYLYVCHLF